MCRELPANHDAAIVDAVEKTPFDLIHVDECEAALACGIDTEQGHAAGFALTGDHGRDFDTTGPYRHASLLKRRRQFSIAECNQVGNAGIVKVIGMMRLDMPRKRLDAVAQHILDHATHHRDHDDHRPDAECDRREHDDGAPMIPPQIAVGEHAQD